MGSGDVRMRSTASDTRSAMRASTRSTNTGSRCATLLASPTWARPAATAMSVAVRVDPPNTSASVVSLYPTDAGPTSAVSSSTMLPPPMPSERTSGIRKLVRMPATLTSFAVSRGKPLISSPMSAVVPPTSITAQSSRPLVAAAPRIEFVGPEANVATG